MKNGPVLRFGSQACLAAVAALLLLFTFNLSAGAKDQDRGGRPSGARGGPAAPSAQPDQPRQAPAPRVQTERPRPAPRPEVQPQQPSQPRPAPQVQRERPRQSPNITPQQTAPQREEARPGPRRVPSNPSITAPYGGEQRTEPGVRSPRSFPGTVKQPEPAAPTPKQPPALNAPTPSRVPPQAARPTGPASGTRRAPSDRVMTQRRVPPGEVTQQKDGSYSVRARTGNQYAVRPNGSVRSFQSERGEAQFHQDGTVRTIRARDFTIQHRPIGRDLVMRERPDHTVIASFGGGRGYIQRPFSARGHDFVQRAYYDGRRPFPRFYRPYRYHGFAMYWYVPAYYYSPIFYSWVYSPWPFGVHFHWGWLDASWYGYYGPYFTPYGVYPAGPFWLTDYLLAWALEQDYLDRRAAVEQEAAAFVPPTRAGQVPLSAEVKQAIADEVKLQLAQAGIDSQTAARNGIPEPGTLDSLLNDREPHVFVVSSPLDVESATGECVLTGGDVLQSTGAPAPNAQVAYLRVLASKAGDCARGSLVAVSLYDLQEMLNRMRETVDQGLNELRSGQGQGGLPSAPSSALGAAVDAPFASSAPPIDPSASVLLNQTETEASQAEQSILGEVMAETEPAPAAMGAIQLGQTIDQVTAILGRPNVMVDMGSKQMYVYPWLKITFTSGRVTDVQ